MKVNKSKLETIVNKHGYEADKDLIKLVEEAYIAGYNKCEQDDYDRKHPYGEVYEW